MGMIYGANRNLLSSSNVTLNKAEKKSTSNSQNTLDERQDFLEAQLAIIEKQHNQILEQAESDKQRILEDAKKMSLSIEKTAYDEGYSQGLKNGYEDGHKKALKDAFSECKLKIDEATNILLSSKNLVKELADNNKEEIIKLAISIAEHVLSKEVKDKEALEAIFNNIASELENKKSIVIKVNPIHKDSIERQVKSLKNEYSLTDDIHILAIYSVKEGNAIIELDDGTISVGYDTVIENIKAELL